MQPHTQSHPTAHPRASFLAIDSDCVAAGNDLAEVVDLLHVVAVLTTHPNWADHERALATVIRIAAETAEHGRDAARRAASAIEREMVHG